jgi:hypothetical protein
MMASGDGPRFYVGYGEMTQITHAFVPSNHDSSIHLQRSMCTLRFPLEQEMRSLSDHRVSHGSAIPSGCNPANKSS